MENIRIENRRIVNIKYKVNNLHFDAAIDCNWCLHDYGVDPIEKTKRTPIELYCFDRPGWGIRVFFQDFSNLQEGRGINHTSCDFDNILKETKDWIIENNEGTTILEDNNIEDLLFE